jgi:hypothetical protein
LFDPWKEKGSSPNCLHDCWDVADSHAFKLCKELLKYRFTHDLLEFKYDSRSYCHCLSGRMEPNVECGPMISSPPNLLSFRSRE